MEKLPFEPESSGADSKIERSAEKEPKINIKLYFTPHGFEKDFEKLGEIFSEADVFIPEVPGWNPDIADIYDDIAQGRLDPKEVAGDDLALLRQLTIIYGSKKPIVFVDIMGDLYSEINEKKKGFEKNGLEAKRLFLAGRFEEAILLASECAKGLADIQQEREKFIRAAILEVLPKMIEKHPDLEDKLKRDEPIKVLLSLGSMHTQIYHKLKLAGADVEQEFSEYPMIFPYWHELERRYMFGKDPSNELVARGLIEVMLSKYIGEFSKSSEENSQVLRKLVSRLSFDQIKKISVQVGVMGKNFLDALSKEGVHVPHSREQFEELLKK